MKLIALLFLSLTFQFSAQAALPGWNLQNPISLPQQEVPTPLLTDGQFYLSAPPIGVGAFEAWSISGGTGKNVKIIDIETCFQTQHEDLKTPFFIGNNPTKTCGSSINHGTAVLGVMVSRFDRTGTIGIAYDAQFGVYGFIEGNEDVVTPKYIAEINKGIDAAIQKLSPGDVMLIEQQMSGPDNYAPVDYWPEIEAKLREATDHGIICVEAAGNGSSNLDGEAYEGAFDMNKRDSGCIMVGAMGQDHNRLYFSNYGSRIDAAGYGGSVTTLGYGDLFNGGPRRLYTNSFSGTSSATPIVAGAIALVSSIAKQQGRILTPKEVRAALRATGTPQSAESAAERVGSLPDIKSLLEYLKLKN